METKNFSKEFRDFVKNDSGKKADHIRTWLDYDLLGDIIVYNGAYWLEKTNSLNTIPVYVREYIKKFMIKNGFIYLYDLDTKSQSR